MRECSSAWCSLIVWLPRDDNNILEISIYCVRYLSIYRYHRYINIFISLHRCTIPCISVYISRYISLVTNSHFFFLKKSDYYFFQFERIDNGSNNFQQNLKFLWQMDGDGKYLVKKVVINFSCLRFWKQGFVSILTNCPTDTQCYKHFLIICWKVRLFLFAGVFWKCQHRAIMIFLKGWNLLELRRVPDDIIKIVLFLKPLVGFWD